MIPFFDIQIFAAVMFVVVANAQIGSADILAKRANVGAGTAVGFRITGFLLDVLMKLLAYWQVLDLIVAGIAAVKLQGEVMLIDFLEQVGTFIFQIIRTLLSRLLAIEDQQAMTRVTQ